MSTQERLQSIRIGTMVSGSGRDPAGYVRQILPYGFESFSLFFSGGVLGVELARLADQVQSVLADSGAVVSSLGIYGNGSPLEDGQADLDTLAAWKTLIDGAHQFGCNIVGGFTGRVRGSSLEESLPRYRQVWGELARRAEDRGVRIAFENCTRTDTWQEGTRNLALTPAAWELMFAEVPSRALGLEWEPCHQMVQLIDPLPQIAAWGSRIYHVHGKCATIRWDVVRQYGINGPRPWAYHRTPGFGDLDWTRVISELRLAGYVGSIDIEGWHDPVYRDALEMTGQVHSLNYLKRCRGGEFVPNPT